MNIVFATSNFLPDVYGGVETYTHSLAQEVQRRGHSVHVVCTTRATLTEPEVQDAEFGGISVRRIAYDPTSRARLSRQIMYDGGMARLVGEALSEWHADIIHVTNFPGISAAVIPEAELRGVPVVWTATDFGMTCARYTLQKWDGSLCPGIAGYAQCLDCVRPRSRINTRCYEALLRLPRATALRTADLLSALPWRKPAIFAASRVTQLRLDTLLPLVGRIDLVIAPSTWMRDVLVLNGVSPDRIVIAEYGIELGPDVSVSRVFHSPPRFGFLGRIHPMKGVDILIEAFKSIEPPGSGSLVIYGSPDREQYEYAGRLWALAKDSPNIAFGKQLRKQQVVGALQDIDVLVAPSTWCENSPLAILEALDRKIPVIASDVAGMRDILSHEVNGLLFRTGDVADLASQMQRLISDPELLLRLAQGIRPVKSIQQDAAALIEQYERVVSCDRSLVP